MLDRNGKLWGSILLIAGTTIGAGMLALPVTTASAGFFPSTILLSLVWAVMLVSAFCFLELSLQLPVGTNLISMAEQTLGTWGKVVAWWVYLALLYALNAAYLSSLSAVLASAAAWAWHINIASWIVALSLIGFFVGLLCWGMKRLDWLNRGLMFGLIFTFTVLCITIIPHGSWSHLQRGYSKNFLFALPVVVTAYGFHIIIPSLTRYCGEQSRKILPKAILIGSLLPLVVYFIWQYAIMSVVPTGQLLEILHSGQPATALPKVLEVTIGHSGLGSVTSWLSFFAITTSFIGVSLSLFDFLLDGLKMQRIPRNVLITVLLTFGPPLAFTLFYPQGFVLALTYAGYFVSYLLIFMPALMVWRQRRKVALAEGLLKVPGGDITLMLLMVFAVIVMLVKTGFLS